MQIHKFLAIATLVLTTVSCLRADETDRKYRPIVLWHGMGDSCCNEKSLGHVMQEIQAFMPGVYIHSIQIGKSESEDRKASFFGNLNNQVDEACEALKNDEQLKDGFNAIGFSQGGQALRAYVQRCNTPRVFNLATFGSQHMGVSDIPNCADKQDGWCKLMRSVVRNNAYSSTVQSRIVQAQYFHDPANEEKYLESCIFLPDINNEHQEKNAEYAENLGSLEHLILVMFNQDKMVTPKETAWFGFYDRDMNVVEMRDQPMYTEDWIGLKQLDEQGKIVFLSVEADHMRIDLDYLKNEILTPYFMNADSETLPQKPKDSDNLLVLQA